MKENRLGAVDHIRIEAPNGSQERLRWFYAEVAGLHEIPPQSEATSNLAFKSSLVELRISLNDAPRLELVRYRITISVDSLDDVIECLTDRKAEFERLTGLGMTDRRIGTVDPGGNRIALKQHWPFSPI